MYYDSLMQGKGLIKRSKQIQIVGQSVYLIVAVALILLRFNLIAIVSAQALSIIIRRVLSYRTIYTGEFKRNLHKVKARARKEILKPVYPNAVKMGLNGLAGQIVLRASMIIGSLYLSLETIASYGITMQITTIISSIAGVYFVTYVPKIAQHRVQGDSMGVKQWYLKSCWLALLTFLTVGSGFILAGDWALSIVKSNTPLLPKPLIAAALFIAFFEVNINIIANICLSKNEVPFLRTSLLVAAITLILLLIFFTCTDLGVLGMIIAPGIAEYLHCVWMATAIKELRITKRDIYHSLHNLRHTIIFYK
jgi:O-antigen/teichoic acid export membrane protein